MLRFLRKYSSSTGIKILYGLLAALFVIWGVGAIGGERIDVVARVEGATITRRDLDRAAANLQSRYEQMLRGQWTPELARSLDLRGQALDQLVDQALLGHEADRLGIKVTDAELDDAIVRVPELQDGGHFSRERLEAFLKSQRDRGEFEDEMRRSLLLERVRSLVTDGVQVSDAELQERYRLDHEQATVAFVRIKSAELGADLALTDEDLQKQLDAHADLYRTATTVRARYVAYRPDEFAKQVEPTDGEIAEYYELNKEDRFTEPQQVHARHILVKVAPNAPTAEREAAHKRAADLLARVKAGEDFAELAKKNSDDQGSAPKGGDLGLLSHGVMPSAFEGAAFDMQPGTTSDLVETPFGFHIIKVEEQREGGVKPLAAVRDEIVAALKKERGTELARKEAEADRRKLARGTPFAESVSGRTVLETPPFSAGADVPGVGRVKDFTETALALRDNEPSDLIETDTAIYLLVPFDRVEAHTPPLADVRDRVMTDLRRDRGNAAAKERGEQLLARAKAAGLDAAAAESGLKVEETDAFDRRTASIPKLGPVLDLRSDAFTLTKEAPLAPRVYDLAGDAIVASLRTRTAADMSGFAAAKETLRGTLLQQKRQATATAYLDHLKERAHREGTLEVYGEKQSRG